MKNHDECSQVPRGRTIESSIGSAFALKELALLSARPVLAVIAHFGASPSIGAALATAASVRYSAGLSGFDHQGGGPSESAGCPKTTRAIACAKSAAENGLVR
jgi:hypothetical protein